MPEPPVVAHSATLAIHEAVQARRRRGERVVHLGFGEAGLPVLPAVADVLAGAVGHNGYGPVAGVEAARDAVAGYYGRRGLATRADQVLLAPGSKALLFALLTALPGDVVLPVPSWVTYAAQAALAGKRVVGVPIAAAAGGVPDPHRFDAALRSARADGAEPGALVLTLPDNPTGTVVSADLLKQVLAVADHHGLAVVSDEIYRDLAYDPGAFVSPAEILPGRTIVTGGLSKSMALGGWRIGFARLPDSPLGRSLLPQLTGIASEVWSSLAMPMQDVVRYVLAEPPEVRERVAASRRLHGAVARAVHGVFTGVGATCRVPRGAFYLYPDLEVVRPLVAGTGVDTGARLAEYLLDTYGVAVLAGAAFGDTPRAFRFRVATSLLYGDDDRQRLAALASDDPASLPWIADALERLRSALGRLAAG